MPEEKPVFDLPDLAKNYLRSQKRWAVGVIVAVIMTLLMCFAQFDFEKQIQHSSIIGGTIKNPELIYAMIASDILIIIVIIICLVSRIIWPGYYFLFGIYLLYAGIYFILNFGGAMSIFLATLSWLLALWALITGTSRLKKQKSVD